MGMSSTSTSQNSQIAAVWAALLVASFAWLNYWRYSFDEYYLELLENHRKILAGTMIAPWQYRILPELIAEVLTRVPHIALRHAYGILDATTLTLATAAALRLARRTGRPLLVGLLGYYLLWTLTNFRTTATMPSVCSTCVCMLLLARFIERGGWYIGIALPIIILQAFSRSDVALAISTAFVVAGILSRRRQPLAIGVLGGLFTIAIQYALTAIIYPAARYDSDTPVVQLPYNILPARWFPFLLFMTPLFWTAYRLWRNRWRDPWSLAVASGAALQLAMWVVLGKADEVRIFLPFAFVLSPLTVRAIAEGDRASANAASLKFAD
jgi:hypothetical protein